MSKPLNKALKSFLLFLLLVSRTSSAAEESTIVSDPARFFQVTAIAATATLAGCLIRCILRCYQCHKVKKILGKFDPNDFLDKTEQAVKKDLMNATEFPTEQVRIVGKANSGSPCTNCFLIVSGTTTGNGLAQQLQGLQANLRTARGIILIFGSFKHKHLEHHEDLTHISRENITKISNFCIENQVPLMILYFEEAQKETRRGNFHPCFTLHTLRIPHAVRYYQDPHKHYNASTLALTVNAVISYFSSTINEETALFVSKDSSDYPLASEASTQREIFLKSIFPKKSEDAAEGTV